MSFTFIDLFAGLGGFRLGLEKVGGECVYSSEFEPNVAKVYEKNFGEYPDGDITKVEVENIPDHNVLAAGFPCQPFSISGLQKGFEDTRGTLFFDVARIVEAKSPEIVFLENVRNFAKHDGGRTLATVEKTLKNLGYNVFHKVLDASKFGSATKRERIFIIGVHDDLEKEFVFPDGEGEVTLLEEILLPDEDTKGLIREREDLVLKNPLPTGDGSPNPVRVGTVGKGGQGERVYSPKGVAITFSSQGGGVFAKTGGYLVNGKTRRLHPREVARAMGFPDSYILSKNDNQAFTQLGNSVSIDVVTAIGRAIVDLLKPS